MKHPAPVSRAIILGNIGVAFADILLTINHPGVDSWLRQLLSLSPANLISGAWWEPLSYMWLHAPPVGFWVTHILFNMLTLSIFGGPVESRLGSLRFAVLYLVGGLAAAFFFLGQVWWEAGFSLQTLSGNTQEIVGASGAVLAVVAAFAVYYPDARLFIFPIPFPIRARKAVLFFIVLSVAFLFVPALSFIGHSAHIGGWWRDICWPGLGGGKCRSPRFSPNRLGKGWTKWPPRWRWRNSGRPISGGNFGNCWMNSAMAAGGR
ncbi:rhomboid family intramembrane serine protease [bacterium]|nr:rhomboid family intramembrane serine protease [bacterium]